MQRAFSVRALLSQEAVGWSEDANVPMSNQSGSSTTFYLLCVTEGGESIPYPTGAPGDKEMTCVTVMCNFGRLVRLFALMIILEGITLLQIKRD